jgi:hypothetical protein
MINEISNEISLIRSFYALPLYFLCSELIPGAGIALQRDGWSLQVHCGTFE